MTTRGRRPPIAWRLSLLLGAIVLGVLLVTGIVVNRVVSRGFATVIADTQQERLADAAGVVDDQLGRPVRLQTTVRQLANRLGGEVRVIATDGTLLAAFGRAPDEPLVTYTAPVMVGDAVVATLEADLPSGTSDRGFLPLFNMTLILGGAVSVLAIALASAYVADRLTRPLRDVASAAHRLGGGEAGARATGGDDRESADLADAFNAMADRLGRSETLRRRAASDIAHDLATPATVLVSQLQAMVDGVVPADRDGLEAARSSAAALGSVVAELNDLASAEAAPLQARPEHVDLAPVAREVALALDGLRRQLDVRLETSIPEPTAIWSDPVHLERILRNVIGNALNHSPAGGRVTVAATTDAGRVTIRVSDEGAGIAPEDIAHIFERFYRADPARRAMDPRTGRRAGTGIGLTIARDLSAANGGSIVVEHTGPDGTTFRIDIPSGSR